MVLYDKNGNQKLYDVNDLAEISTLVSNISYAEGFIKAVIWDESPSADNSVLAKHLAKKLIEEDMEECKKIVPEKIRERIDFNELEKICKKILKE